jgi:hypothetical protein
LPERVAVAVVELVYRALAENPLRCRHVSPFRSRGPEGASRGDFRISYRIGDQVTILAIEHRADVHRQK